MSVLVHPELARLAMRQGVELPFVVWSILRDSTIAQNGSSHYSKKDAVRICSDKGLRFTPRHWSRIWEQGQGIFWGIDKNHIFIRSFRRVCWRFSALINDKDLSRQAKALFIKIQLSGGMEDLRAQLYHAWFLQWEEKTISRATLQDLFGLTPRQQRSLEKLLGNRLLIKTNYAHINAASYTENPRELPKHHFTINYEREIRFDEDIDSVAAIQYQLPNTFLARFDEHGESPAVEASNRARKAAGALFRDTDTLNQLKRTYWLKWSQFENLGTLDSLIRAYFQGKKRLWITGHYC